MPPEEPLIAATPAEQRAAAQAALDQGRPDECLRLLDRAKEKDPAGDASPPIRTLRDRAEHALHEKKPTP
jgi:hypothetical protein